MIFLPPGITRQSFSVLRYRVHGQTHLKMVGCRVRLYGPPDTVNFLHCSCLKPPGQYVHLDLLGLFLQFLQPLVSLLPRLHHNQRDHRDPQGGQTPLQKPWPPSPPVPVLPVLLLIFLPVPVLACAVDRGEVYPTSLHSSELPRYPCTWDLLDLYTVVPRSLDLPFFF